MLLLTIHVLSTQLDTTARVNRYPFYRFCRACKLGEVDNAVPAMSHPGAACRNRNGFPRARERVKVSACPASSARFSF
jgi:hypothetical protein